MKSQKLILKLLLLSLILSSATSIDAVNKKRTFHFQLPKKGDQFFYKGVVKWEVATEPRQKEVIWTVDVVDVMTRRNYFVAEIKGFPSDLMGFGDFGEDDPKPQDYYYVINKQAGEICICDDLPSLKRRKLSQLSDILLNLAESPHGKRLYLDWVLETRRRVDIDDIKGVPPRRYFKYTFGNRTNPDAMIIDFTPEIGVIAYKYIHYGSISEVDMKLIEIKHSK